MTSPMAALGLAAAALAGTGFTSDRRLYRLAGDGPLAELLLEAWSLREELNQPWLMELAALAVRPDLDLEAMLGQRLELHATLADGGSLMRAGVVTAARAEESDGGFARYRLDVQPWLALLAYTRRSQVWQEQALPDILGSVFSRYAAYASWRWADCVAAHLAQSAFTSADGVRSYTVQYRETDLQFVQRLLAEEGLVFRFEPDDAAPMGHTMVILADTVSAASCPEDDMSASGLGGPGIRFHRAGIIEDQDTLQALGGERALPTAVATATGWDYKAKRVVAASTPTRGGFGGEQAPWLEGFDHCGAYPFATRAQAERALELAQQALETGHKRWVGRSTVRTFAPGLHLHVSTSLLDHLDPVEGGASPAERKRLLLTRVVHAGINNLPKDGNQAIVQPRTEGGADLLADWVDAEVKAQAAAAGYGNAFEAQRAAVPWRARLHDDSGQRLNPKPTVDGPLLATVVGPGGPEIHTDALGRIRIRYDFQTQPGQGPNTTAGSTWVRVLQRHAGPGMGLQFIPRVGQQVLVDFFDADIDRPLVVGTLYDGRGECGLAPTPGGAGGSTDLAALGLSSDHRPSAQGNLSGGHSPAWHGASAADAVPQGGQRNAAALTGWKSQEFSGIGYNQLVFDDSNEQLRLQMHSSAHASQLNLGHLIHQADNHRGSLRGLGFELRTDAYGAIRGGAGVLLSTFEAAPEQPAGHNPEGIALAQEMKELAQRLNQAAQTHQTVPLSAHLGSVAAGQSTLDPKLAPLAAIHHALQGQVDELDPEQAQADAAAKRTTASESTVPHPTDPLLSLAARAGLTATAGLDLQLAAGEGITTTSGQDTHWGSGGATRIHTGQAIGMLAGAEKPGTQAAGKGFTLISAEGPIDIQAQNDTLQIAAEHDLLMESEHGHLDFASPKRISLTTGGGANITIEGGNITVQCPGTITVLAGHKSFLAPGVVNYALPQMPAQPCISCLLNALRSGSALALV